MGRVFSNAAASLLSSAEAEAGQSVFLPDT